MHVCLLQPLSSVIRQRLEGHFDQGTSWLQSRRVAGKVPLEQRIATFSKYCLSNLPMVPNIVYIESSNYKNYNHQFSVRTHTPFRLHVLHALLLFPNVCSITPKLSNTLHARLTLLRWPSDWFLTLIRLFQSERFRQMSPEPT